VGGSRADASRRPDWICFDVDPTSGRFADAAKAALLLKAVLDGLRRTSFVKTSGGRGVHVFVPLQRGPDADDVLAFAESVGSRLAAGTPRELTAAQRLAARRGRVSLAPFRNGFGQPVVAPWWVRRRPAAPISTPLAWDELAPRLKPERFNLRSIDARLSA